MRADKANIMLVEPAIVSRVTRPRAKQILHSARCGLGKSSILGPAHLLDLDAARIHKQ